MNANPRPTRGSGKKTECRTTINVLVLGDEGVGKSSLISTYVSRHFSEGVPGIMTRVRLPPEPDSPCVTTIVDSQGGDAALISAVTAMSLSSPNSSSNSLSSLVQRATVEGVSSDYSGSGGIAAGVEHVDSIILVYDLDRVETFYRLENHWLPLIERCYNGELPVIVAGNKMDLFRPSSSAGMTDEHALARSRQQINSLLQRFKFVLQWIKCSAKNLLHIDEVFRKAQQSVLYPITPLYDLSTARLTADCRRALTRVFRMYDRDNDGLLSNDELDAFQCQAFPVRLVERDFAGWKKVVSRNNTSDDAVVRDGKFTVAGFLAIFEVFVTQNRLESPWRALRYFGYDDELNLRVPPSVTLPVGDKSINNWRLSSSARQFLAATFHQFDSDKDGKLSPSDVQVIFSIVPEPSLPPWHPERAPSAFQGCFSLPKLSRSGPATDSSGFADNAHVAMSSSLSASGITICSAASLPSVDVSCGKEEVHASPESLSFLDWMGLWHMISSISPSTTRAELYRLGHVTDASRGTQSLSIRKGASTSTVAHSSVGALPSREVRILVLGSRGCGKTALLNALCCVNQSTASSGRFMDTSRTNRPETSFASVKLIRKPETVGAKVDGAREELVVHLIFTEVPAADPQHQERHQSELSDLLAADSARKNQSFDAVLLVFDCTKCSSLTYVKDIENSFLGEEMPRIFVGTKKDIAEASEVAGEERDVGEDYISKNLSAADMASHHCMELDLETPYLVSVTDSMLGGSSDACNTERTNALDHLARCVLVDEDGLDQLRSTPHAEKKRRESARRRTKMIWLGGLVSVSVAVAVGVGVFWGGATKGGRKDRISGWLRQLLGGAIVGMTSPPASGH